MAKTEETNLFKQLVLTVAIGVILRLMLAKLGWHPPSLENRMFPVLVLWMIFAIYWVSRD